MELPTLERADATVANPRRVLEGMGLGASRIRRVAQRRNTHWLAETPAGRVVLRRYAADRSAGDVAYELRLLQHLEGRGWPVATPLAPAVEAAGSIWCAFPYLPGRAPAPRSGAGQREEQRRRGRLLARLHADLAEFAVHGQREGWRRADEGLFERRGGPPMDEVLSLYERMAPEEGRVLRAYAEHTRTRLRELLPHAPPPTVIHGDFTPWNIRYEGGVLSAILDFDAAHLDLRVAEFALAWRGRHDEVVRGYEEVSPLAPVERELLLPIYWAWVIASAVAGLDAGETNAEWAVRHLLRTELVSAKRSIARRRPTSRAARGG